MNTENLKNKIVLSDTATSTDNNGEIEIYYFSIEDETVAATVFKELTGRNTTQECDEYTAENNLSNDDITYCGVTIGLERYAETDKNGIHEIRAFTIATTIENNGECVDIETYDIDDPALLEMLSDMVYLTETSKG